MEAELTILIVDDEKLQREIVTGILEEVGYSVVLASSGKEALKMLERETVDLILLDIIMPRMDGVETCRQIKKIDRLKSIPVIMLTALNNEDDVIKSLDAGADDFINKSSGAKVIHARVKAHIRTKLLFNEIDKIRKAEASVMDVMLDITSTQDTRTVLQLLVEKTSMQIGMDVSVFLIDESKQSGTIVAYSVGDGKKDIHIDLSKYPEIRESLVTGEPVFISDTENDLLVKEVAPLLRELHISSIMVIPLAFQDDLMGTLILKARGAEKVFDEEDIRLSKIMAGAASNAIKNASVISTLETQKVREERYILAMKGANDGLWDRDVKTGEVYFSPRWKEMLGYKDGELPNCHKEWEKRIHPDDCNRVIKDIKDHFEGNTPYYLTEYRIRHKDGSYRWVMARGATIRDKNGEPIRFAGSHTNITERKKMEEELLNVQKLESLALLAGGIAHDFNNILMAIVGSLCIAKEFATEDNELFKMLNNAEAASFRARDLTQQLLTFSKGGAPIIKTATIAKLLEESASFALRGSKVKCNMQIPDKLWAAKFDEGQISQVINNLLINAGQAMTHGGMVTVRAENVELSFEDMLPLQSGLYIKIRIQDKGCGILEENLDKIYDPYFSTKETGSGLGLATSYSIIKKHKGHIRVESKSGVGTTFTIYLPASQDKPAAKEQQKTLPQMGVGEILVLEDDEMVSETVGEMLNRAGYKAEFAKDGKEALEIYRDRKESDRPFDLVILDLTIPGCMGGEETIKELKTIDPNVKAVVSSGYANSPIMSDYKKYGFDGCIPKPYLARELIEKLHYVLSKKD